ncbi:aminodeoxychorismate/anthranilate synthase component II [Methanosarcinales archaeon ex4572_44]|nr:MAG: aminodeoxychorismate/anthranilate synthase component II [Methanosarcinales archaeon ex4484_138]PHP45923.1 MAG: aminodeoxychorismate/anthranilate synthase component II [Methanosarcinales archaeon ex4572_44]RLG28467.1 MAG: aminodeoxychorismate/anthranilate synthase component II [Methanosarcinales archaeon]
MKVLFINNRDSFVWNLVDYVSRFEPETLVVPHTITVDEVRMIAPDAIIISPGPGHPTNDRDIGNCLKIIKDFRETPQLGVCLGHQAIAVAFGGKVGHSPEGPIHGKTAHVYHDSKCIYQGIKNPFEAGRYHSLTVTQMPEEFIRTAQTNNGLLMGMRHETYPIEGVQFHPESVLTPTGLKIIENFLKIC